MVSAASILVEKTSWYMSGWDLADGIEGRQAFVSGIRDGGRGHREDLQDSLCISPMGSRKVAIKDFLPVSQLAGFPEV